MWNSWAVLIFIVNIAIVNGCRPQFDKRNIDMSSNKTIEVYLKPKENVTCLYNQTAKFIYGETFSVKVYNDILNGSCSTIDKLTYIPSFDVKDDYSVSTIKPTADIRSNLTCTFLVPCRQQTDACSVSTEQKTKSYVSVKCSMQLDIRNPIDLKNFVSINGNKIKTNQSNDDPNVDVHGLYNFYDGEPASVKCNNNYIRGLYYSEMSVHYMAGNKKMYYYKYATTRLLTMYVKLTEEYEYGHINCDVSSPGNYQSLYTRIRLKMRDSNSGEGALGFHVNGLSLKQFTENKPSGDLNFKYEYYDGENLTITSIGDLECQNFKDETILLTANQYDNSTIVTCNAQADPNKTVSLKLKPQTFFDDLRLEGLSMDKILQKLYFVKKQIIRYQYEEEEHIKCISTSLPDFYLSQEIKTEGQYLKWIHNDKNKMKYEYVVLGTKFRLEINETRGRITCSNSKHSIHVNIERGEFNSKKQGGDDINYRRSWVIILGSICGALVLATVVCFTIRARKKRVKTDPAHASHEDEHHYEEINNDLRLHPLPCNAVAANIGQRPPMPLPAEALEENRRYVHYDTPYEWRIWRRGRIACSCNKCVPPSSPQL